MTKLSTRTEALADRLFQEYQEAENMTAYHHGLVRVVNALDGLASKLRRRGL